MRIGRGGGRLERLFAGSERPRARAGAGRIEYRQADLNTLRLSPNTYDVVFFHQSLHHVRSVEKLLARVERALTPDGLLFLDEWTGPSRRDWTDERLAPLRRIYAALPAEWRRFEILQKPLEINDLSETIRSSVILPAVRRVFDVVADKPYGGQIVSVILPQLERTRVPPEELDRLIARWLAAEDEEIARDPSRSYHTVLVARRKAGLRRAAGHLRTFAVRAALAARYRIPTAWRSFVGKHVPPEDVPPADRIRLNI
jgi:SAM-dependent methyltransferase